MWGHLSFSLLALYRKQTSYISSYFSVVSAVAETHSFVSNGSPSRPLRVLSITSPKNSPWTPTGGELLRKLHLSWEKCVHMWAMGWKCLCETSSHCCSNCWPLKVEARNGGKTEGNLREEKSFSGQAPLPLTVSNLKPCLDFLSELSVPRQLTACLVYHSVFSLNWWTSCSAASVLSCMIQISCFSCDLMYVDSFLYIFFISALLKIFKQAQNLLSCAVQGSCDEDIIQWMIVSQLHHDPCSCGLNLAAPVILGLTHNPWPMDEITKIISLITWFCFASLSQWPLRYPFYSKHNSLHPYWRPWTFFLLSAAFPKLSWLKGLTGVSLYICYKLYKLYCRELERRWPCIWGEHNSPAFLTGGNL